MKPAGVFRVLLLILAALAAWATTAQSTKPQLTTQQVPIHVAAKAETSKSHPISELKFGDERIARVEGMLVGKERREYSFDARKGQKIALTLSSDRSPWIGMDLLAAPIFASTYKDAPTVYTNFIDGSTRWEGVVPADGTYTLRLGLLNAQARKLDRVDYSLDVNLR
jgi:hypothetical protein